MITIGYVLRGCATLCVASFESAKESEECRLSLGNSVVLWEVLDIDEDYGVSSEPCEFRVRRMKIQEVYGE